MTCVATGVHQVLEHFGHTWRLARGGVVISVPHMPHDQRVGRAAVDSFRLACQRSASVITSRTNPNSAALEIVRTCFSNSSAVRSKPSVCAR